MDNTTNNSNSAFVQVTDEYNKKTKAVPKQQASFGIDTSESLFDNIIKAGIASKLDITELESFSQVSQNRNQIYDLLDTMSEDSTIAAVLETYAEDATEYGDNGKIVWVESADSDVSNYVTYLLDTMNIDKNIYKWVHSLCKYGDVYLRLYRESEYKDPIFQTDEEVYDSNKGIQSKEKTPLNEEVKVKAYKNDDKYVHYLEMIPNPAEVFELTKFGKTYGYIKADVSTQKKVDNLQTQYYQYRFKKKDVEIYDAKSFVHACLEDNTTRTPEEVDIFIDDQTDINSDAHTSYSYTVKRGQSLLYNVFKIWRELMLLENSILLNRISKSSIVRVIGVEVGDMPKENVAQHLLGIKQLVEQKAAFNEGKSMSEYTNPGPIENNIYVPTKNGVGALSTQQIGGDVDVKSLADLDYFKNKFFGALRVPKQYFGDTDDAAGFSGGESLSLISSRYAKMVKRIQNTILQALTDAINLMLLDKGLNTYINKFTLHMQTPTTSEERDRRENVTSKIAVVSDIMTLLSDIDDVASKLKILKSLLANVVTDSEIIDILQEEIDKLENDNLDNVESDDNAEDIDTANLNFDDNFGSGKLDNPVTSADANSDKTNSEDTLPSPEDLGVDMTDSNNSDFD